MSRVEKVVEGSQRKRRLSAENCENCFHEIDQCVLQFFLRLAQRRFGWGQFGVSAEFEVIRKVKLADVELVKTILIESFTLRALHTQLHLSNLSSVGVCVRAEERIVQQLHVLSWLALFELVSSV